MVKRTTRAQGWAARERGQRWIAAIDLLRTIGVVNRPGRTDPVNRIVVVSRVALVVSVDIQIALKIDVLIGIDGCVRFNGWHDDEFSLNLALGAGRIE